MKRTCYHIILIALITYGYSCKEEGNAYIDKSAPAPEQVSGIKIESTPGGAVITYNIPDDRNLSYVKAVYEIQPGIFRTAKASYYTDTLELVGFGDTLSHKVKIYSVGRNQKESDPISVKVKPLTPPVKSVFKTLTLDATFGGVSVSFKDPDQADLAIHVIVDSTGQNTWAPVTTYYTAALTGSFAARGFDSIEKKFAVYIQDHWNNKSDTLVKSLTPFYEVLIPKNKFVCIHLPSDSWEHLSHYPVEHLWNGIYNVREDWFKSKNTDYPQWFTIDMGVKVTLSRMKLYRIIQYPWATDWIKDFEIWGSNNPDDDWDNWQLLGKFTLHKPSGLPGSQHTADDLDFQAAGEDYSFPIGTPAVRYIRFKVIDNLGGGGFFYSGSEMTFWGQIVQ